jgi:hypothetical protein
MSAGTHRRNPSPERGAREARLPWWAIALPVIAFTALALLSGPPDAHAAGSAPSGLDRIVFRVQEILVRANA